MYELGVAHEPEIVAVVGAVEAKSDARTAHFDDGAYACGCCVARVVGFELVAGFELVFRRLDVLAKAGRWRGFGVGLF